MKSTKVKITMITGDTHICVIQSNGVGWWSKLSYSDNSGYLMPLNLESGEKIIINNKHLVTALEIKV